MKISNLTVGMEVYENCHGCSVKLTVTSGPQHVKNGDSMAWQAQAQGPWGNVTLFADDNAPHYGPRLSLQPEYRVIE